MTKPATINGTEASTARILAEFCNATDCRTATMTAYFLRSSQFNWMDVVEPVEVTIDLRAGHSSTDHLFDRVAARVIDRVHGKLFASVEEIRKAASRVQRPECDYTVTVVPSGTYEGGIPAALEGRSEEIRDAVRAKDRAGDLARRRKEFAALGLVPESRGDHWVIVSSRKACGDTRYTYRLNIQQRNHHVGLCCPGERFAAEAEAAAKIAAYKAAIGA